MASIHERLPDLSLPVLLVWGMRDPVFQPVFLEQWRELLPKAETVELAEASHFLVEDDPDGVTDAIASFLR
jgi:haloalkane dehalogenase